MESSASVVFRFGPFEANAVSGELLKAGRRIKIQDQPFRLLVVLLESGGRVVTRDEIQRRIWNGDTFVDFDSSLRVAVRKLRDALGDSAEQPQYVETIPKRGYRFLSPVTVGATPVSPATNAADVAATTPPPPAPVVESRRRVRLAPVAVALALLAAATLAAVFRARSNASAAEALVIADFANSTGDAVFDDALRQGLAIALERSHVLSLVSEERIQSTLRLMGRPGGGRLTPELALDVCRRTAAGVTIDGSIGSVGTAYVVGVRARNCRTGDVLDEDQAQAPRKEDVLPALDRIASRLRTRLGESLPSGAQADPPLAEATTSSLEALKAYSTGWRVSVSKGEASAVPFFERAVELDPRFAMAHAALGLMYSSSGQPTRAAESTSRAYALRDRVSDYERFFITAYYDGRVTGNQEKARQTCEAWALAYPRDPLPHEMLAGFVDIGLGRLETALNEALQGLAFNPDAEISHFQVASIRLSLENADEADRVLRRAARYRFASQQLALLEYDLAFYRNDADRMSAAVRAARTDPENDDWMSQRQAFVLAYGGRLQEAVAMSRRAAAIATEAGRVDRAALFAVPPAIWQAWSGDLAGARQTAEAALQAATSREVQFGAALALAMAGEPAKAEALASDLERRYPEDTGVEFTYVPTIRAMVSLRHQDPATAIAQLDVARAYELAVPRSRIQAFFGALYPVYVRGEAYLAAGRGRDAAAEFQKIVDHRGIVLSDPIGALAHLGLGRAYALAGDTGRAAASYAQFLALWKDADADLGTLSQARAEYSTLPH